ncbi:MAG TPA: hypothetical protein VEQ60_20145 [Longimicrobium sp.]|nr:hypothetical protein [Longimicrobium sp.]
MPMRTPSAEISAEIQRQIDALGPAPGEAWHPGAWPTRVCKEELGALPLWADLIFTWALRPDGTVLRMDRDTLFHPTEPETDSFTLYAVLEQASRMTPGLAPLVPDPPAGTRRCTACGGAGGFERQADGKTRTDFCQSCGGLGWVDYPDPSAGESALP